MLEQQIAEIDCEAHTFAQEMMARGSGFAEASADMKFATAVAAFGLRLRDSAAEAPVALAEIEKWARAGGESSGRGEFLGMVQAAERFMR